MTPERVRRLVGRYPSLSVAVFGDFCLDRYLEIDPAREEISIETDLPAHQVVRVRSQPGAAGTVMNNLVALGVGTRYAVGISGDDGEGYELRQALGAQGVDTDHLVVSAKRRTFTYTKPLVMEAGKSPRELSRLDIRNWSATPEDLQDRALAGLRALLSKVQAVLIMDQVSEPDHGVITARVRTGLAELAAKHPEVVFLSDSRKFIGEFRNVALKLNRNELRQASSAAARARKDDSVLALELAGRQGRPVFVTLAEEGAWAVDRGGVTPIRPIRLEGPLDVVGAGDAVSANVATALAAGATPAEAAFLGNLAGSIVAQKIGTTGTASPEELIRRAERIADRPDEPIRA